MAESLSILVVDDNPAMTVSLADVLKLKGYEVLTAPSGEKALAILQEFPVDVLITDVIMPGMNGLELFRATRKTHPNLITWFMTAYAADDLIQQGFREGIKTILNKPLDMDLLILFLNATSKIDQ